MAGSILFYLTDGQVIPPEQAIPQLLEALIAAMNEGDRHAEIILRLWMWEGAANALDAAVSRHGARVAWDEHNPLTYLDVQCRFLGVQVSDEPNSHDNE